MKTLKLGIAVLLIMVVAAGCGYRLAGGGYVNENVTRVTVGVFENRSSEPGAGVSFTNELIREITSKTDTRVVDEAGRKIAGTVKSITFATLSRSSSTSVTERRVTAVVDVKLIDAEGEILWSVKDFSAQESYDVSDNSVEDEADKRQAVETIAQRVAERLVSRMTSNF
ncbi:MAG: hypothetical protein HUN04_03670 [Desulfobacter sp.]|nr:MAG: hypothetical protein HUN04_03670 [Desulfobacter sp.]